MANQLNEKAESWQQTRLWPTLLLLSDDDAVADLVCEIAKPPWKVDRQGVDGYMGGLNISTRPNVLLVVLDDQRIQEGDRGWLLAQIRKRFSGVPLLYVAGSQSDGNERRARSSGAHYYVSKPLAPERFGEVLESFLRAQQVQGQIIHPAQGRSAMTAKKSTAKKPRAPIDAGIRRLAEELNREDSQLRPRVLDTALAGLRLARNPESPELRCDAAQVWSAIQLILSHHLDIEDRRLLPWLEQQDRLSPEVVLKVRECHDKLRRLLGSIVDAGADHLTDVKARDAGRALSGLAVHLDDMIDDEERRLFPTIQKALFAARRRV